MGTDQRAIVGYLGAAVVFALIGDVVKQKTQSVPAGSYVKILLGGGLGTGLLVLISETGGAAAGPGNNIIWCQRTAKAVRHKPPAASWTTSGRRRSTALSESGAASQGSQAGMIATANSSNKGSQASSRNSPSRPKTNR